VYAAFLDASKAFDKVNHGKLFRKLLSNGTPVCIVRLLWHWYSEQTINVSWGYSLSTNIKVKNGVRQGSLLSPLLFNVYLCALSKRLNSLEVGCKIASLVLNHLLYADDIVLISPSVQGLRKLLKICEIYGKEFDITFNPSKSHCMYFLPAKFKIVKAGSVNFCGNSLKCVDKLTYLGHVIACDLSDESDMLRQKRLFYCR